MITQKNNGEHPLERSPAGRHVFGGHPHHKGITPQGSEVPTHRIFEIDLSDPTLPFTSPDLRSLPLYYPLKYGSGGPVMQYRVISESEIQIIHMDPADPDDEEGAYVQVSEFPEVRFNLLPAIVPGQGLPFSAATLGGTVPYGGDQECMNTACPNHGSSAGCELLATIPPVDIEGHEGIWHEFEGGYLFFHFWYCRGCDTIITANRCT